MLFVLAINVGAQDKKSEKEFLSAKDSKPSNFKWMEGFPPPEDKVLHTWDGSFFEFPSIRWSLVHIREKFLTVRVSRGSKAAKSFDYKIDNNINTLTFPHGAKKNR